MRRTDGRLLEGVGRMNLALLHGFWGQPSDWNDLLKRLPLTTRVWTPDFYEPGPLAPHHSLEEWTPHFLEELDREFGGESVALIGYSMGGRLATHALIAAPERFSKALILSANPIWSVEQDPDRKAWEKEWIRKFLKEDWSVLHEEWQKLGIFSASPVLARRESSRLREMLGQSLWNWSPSRHAFSPDQVKSLEASVTWAFGASDQKYVKIGKSLQELPVKGQIVMIPNAGHRLITEAVDFMLDWGAG